MAYGIISIGLILAKPPPPTVYNTSFRSSLEDEALQMEH